MSEQQKQEPVNLVDPGVPADQGLSSLGLLMQLGGSLFAAAATLMTFVMLLAAGLGGGRGSDKLIILLVLGASVTRSVFHRMAGTELLYGKRSLDGVSSAMGGVKRYVAIGLAHSALVFLVLAGKFHVPTKLAAGIALGFAVWPATLGILMMLPRFRRFSGAMPVAEDKGFEGASILMTVLGTCGALASSMFLIMMLSAGGRAMSSGPGVLILIAVVLLVIRSGLHVQAGLSGLRTTSVDRSVELANRYANFGVISAFCAAGAILLLMMSMMRGRFDPSGLIFVVGLCWMLMSWPLIIRRFFSERQFADLMAGDGGTVHRRSPDAGLVGLGWLLFAHAMMSVALLVPQLFVEPGEMSRGMAQGMAMLGGSVRSLWWSVGLIALQAWAGYELVRMSSTHRIIGTVYAIIAIIISVYLTWPVLQALKHIGRMGPQGIAMFIPMAMQLVIPVATLILVNRNIAPTAQARFRTPPAAPQA
ncbi:MAG: hypothetical protein H0T46_33150 [Deltaproteobacteria bacterium]|nr:hypothetical protein [Deltaproteobacteria bacterium]